MNFLCFSKISIHMLTTPSPSIFLIYPPLSLISHKKQQQQHKARIFKSLTIYIYSLHLGMDVIMHQVIKDAICNTCSAPSLVQYAWVIKKVPKNVQHKKKLSRYRVRERESGGGELYHLSALWQLFVSFANKISSFFSALRIEKSSCESETSYENSD